MDRNLLLAFALSFLVLSLWTMWFGPQRRGPSEAPTPTASPAPVATDAGAEAGPGPTPDAGPPTQAEQAWETDAERRTLRVETSLYVAELDTLGAGLGQWSLREYDTGPRHGREPIVLTTGRAPDARALLTPFEELGLGDLSRAVFEHRFVDPYTIVFQMTRSGVSVRKTYAFEPDGYQLRLRVEVANDSDRGVAPRFRVRWPAHVTEGPDFAEQALVAFADGEVERELVGRFGKRGFIGRGQSERSLTGGVDWAGVQTTYFLAALLPDLPGQAVARFVAIDPGRAAATEIFFEPAVQLGPGQSAEREFRGYLGPKEPERLEALGAYTVRSIDLGWSWVRPLTRFFNWLLHALVLAVPGQNYGVAIILLTLLVRLVTVPLTTKQMRSMERMRTLAPKLKEVQEKYKDDRQKQSEQTFALYKREKVNPLGGCFPMLLQLPVFIGLFYALRSSIELRQAPFVAWIDDLSAPEALFEIPGLGVPVRVLPLLMGASMIAQQKLAPTSPGTMDPTQQKMMMWMLPAVMTVVFYQFASGLVLYWMVSNVLAIAHQRWIGRRMRV